MVVVAVLSEKQYSIFRDCGFSQQFLRIIDHVMIPVYFLEKSQTIFHNGFALLWMCLAPMKSLLDIRKIVIHGHIMYPRQKIVVKPLSPTTLLFKNHRSRIQFPRSPVPRTCPTINVQNILVLDHFRSVDPSGRRTIYIFLGHCIANKILAGNHFAQISPLRKIIFASSVVACAKYDLGRLLAEWDAFVVGAE